MIGLFPKARKSCSGSCFPHWFGFSCGLGIRKESVIRALGKTQKSILLWKTFFKRFFLGGGGGGGVNTRKFLKF